MSAAERKQFATAFGRVLRFIREGAHLSQEELAHRADLDRTTPSLLERGRSGPTAYNLVRIARVLEVDPPLLLRMTLRRMEVDLGTGTAMSKRKASCEIANQQPSYGIGDKVIIINPQKRRDDLGSVLYVCGVTAGQVQLSHDGRAWDGSPWLSVNDISHA